MFQNVADLGGIRDCVHLTQLTAYICFNNNSMLLLTTPILNGAVIMSHLRHVFRIKAMHKNADHNLVTN